MTKDQEAMWNRLKEPAPIMDEYRTKRWYNKAGKVHRDNDLPAVIWEDGYKEWWINGKRHKDNDLPAIIFEDGSKAWWVNGERHRDNDLPAYIMISGYKEWYVNGKYIRSEEPDE